LKFLGKIFFEEATSSQRVLGCFIALSGANGNVRGHYLALKKHRSDITLLDGDDLLEEVRKIYPFEALRVVSDKLDLFTERRPRLLELAYYDAALYWVVGFDHDTFTLLNPGGDPLTGSESEPIRTLVESTLSLGHFIDLRDEARARRRTAEVEIELIAQVMLDGGGTDPSVIPEKVPGLTPDEVSRAARELAERGLLETDVTGKQLQIAAREGTPTPATVAEVYRLLTRHVLPLRVLGCPYYDTHIDVGFLEEVRRAQNGLPLTGADIEHVVALIRLSPTALRTALNPIEVIVNGRPAGFATPEIDRAHRDLFLHLLHQGLQRDFAEPVLAAYFHDVRKLRELEWAYAIRVKSESRVELETQMKVRDGIGLFQPRADAAAIPIPLRVFNEAPEPWERDKPTGPPAAGLVQRRIERGFN
jgi:hypothetical protein